MLSLVITLIAVFAYSGNAQTLLTAGQEYTAQVAGSWYYHVSAEAGLAGFLQFDVYNNTAGTYTVCVSNCANDINSCFASCSGPGSCSVEVPPCVYGRGHDYYFYVETTNSSTSFSIRLTEITQNVPVLTSTPTSWNSSDSPFTYSVFSFEVSDTDALNYVKISLADGSSANEAGIGGAGTIYYGGENQYGEESLCAVTAANFLSYQSVLGLLSPFCPFKGGKYYVVLPNNNYNGYNLQISFQTYNTDATALPVGSNSYTISASQTNQFQFFYFDQGNTAITTITFSTTESGNSRIIRPALVTETDSKRLYPVATGTGCPVSGNTLNSGNGDISYVRYPCSPSQGRVFYGFFPRVVPYTVTIDRDDNTDPSTEYNTTSIGTLTDLDHTFGTQKREHYWKIRDGVDLARGDDYFEIFYNNSNNSVTASLYITRDAPSETSGCMAQNYALQCNQNEVCYFGVPACGALGEGQFYLTIRMENTPPTNVPGSFQVTIQGTTRVDRDSSNTYNLRGREIQAYSYSSSRQIVDMITVDRAANNNVLIYAKLAKAVGEDTCSAADFVDITCGQFPCSYPVFCNQNNLGNVLITGFPQTATQINYTLSAASYGDNSAYGRKMVKDQSLTFTVLAGNTMYVYFTTDGGEGFKITADKTTRTSAQYKLYRNDDCSNDYSFNAGSGSTSDEYVFTNKPNMDSNGEYYFTVTNNDNNENNTFTLLLQTGDKNKIQFCNVISSNVSFCSAYINNGNGYAMSNSEALALDTHALIMYNHYAFHDASTQCMSDVKDWICSQLFKPCSDNGATDNTCDKTCHDVLSNCPSDEACLYETCVTYLPCVLIYPSSSTNVIYSLGLMLMIALLQFI